MPELLDGVDFYDRPTPYAVLGVPTDASAGQIRDRHSELQHDLNETVGNPAQRAKKMEPLDGAYNRLRLARDRMQIDFFLLDPQAERKHCETLVQTLPRPNTEVSGLIKPGQVRVSHEAVLAELRVYFSEPPRVDGLHMRPLDFSESDALPEPLRPTFDC